MPSIVNTNMLALTTQRQMNKAQATQQNAMTRLSSGLRINGAKDDAAGMSIANRMSSQITGLNQATRNANDGISLTQTAEGGLSEINTNLQRMRELAVQSANASNTASDRVALQQETKQLLQEIQRVASTTDFNGIKLLDGSFQNKAFQIGANAGQTTNISVASAAIKDLGSSANSAITSRGMSTNKSNAALNGAAGTNAPAMALGDVIVNGVSVGASTADNDTTSFSLGAASAIAKAAAFNKVSAQTGVTATVNANEVQGKEMTAGGSGSGKIVINGVATDDITLQDVTSDSTGIANRTNIMNAINSMTGRTGVTAVDSGDNKTGIKLVAADGRNISLGVTDASLTTANTGLNLSGTGVLASTNATDLANASDAAYGVFTASVTLSSTKEMKIEQGTGDVGNAGLTTGTYQAQKAMVMTKQIGNGDGTLNATEGFTYGDFKINGILIGTSLAADDKYTLPGTANPEVSAIAKAAAVNKLSSLTGVSATANTTLVKGATMDNNSQSGQIVINGMETSVITTTSNTTAANQAETRQRVVAAINAISGKTGVKAIDTNDAASGIRLEAADGRNITVDLGAGTTNPGAGTGASFGLREGTYSGSISLSSTKAFSIERGTTNRDTNATLGLAVGTYGAGRTGQSLESIDISSQEGAVAAIEAIDNAINAVDESRVNMGSYQNRFTSTVSALQSTSANLTAARSRIQDADFAAESAEMSKAGILQQAGTAMLAQANASSQGVLSLLR